MEKRSLNSVVRFGLLTTAELSDGFLSLAPAGGFRDASTPHFLKVWDSLTFVLPRCFRLALLCSIDLCHFYSPCCLINLCLRFSWSA
jgi:hypothetical protein